LRDYDLVFFPELLVDCVDKSRPPSWCGKGSRAVGRAASFHAAREAFGRVDFVLGFSFGAVRLWDAMSAVPEMAALPTLFISPAPPPGTSLTAVGGMRWQLVREALENLAGGDTHSLKELVSGRRGLPKIRTELGLISLVGRLDENREFLRGLVDSDAPVTPKQRLAIGQGDYALRMVGGKPRIRAERANFFSQICAAYPSDHESAQGSSWARLLLMKCGTQEARPSQLDRVRGSCLVVMVNDRDTIVPPVQQRAWAQISPVRFVHYAEPGHTPPQDATLRKQVAGMFATRCG